MSNQTYLVIGRVSDEENSAYSTDSDSYLNAAIKVAKYIFEHEIDHEDHEEDQSYDIYIDFVFGPTQQHVIDLSFTFENGQMEYSYNPEHYPTYIPKHI